MLVKTLLILKSLSAGNFKSAQCWEMRVIYGIRESILLRVGWAFLIAQINISLSPGRSLDIPRDRALTTSQKSPSLF